MKKITLTMVLFISAFSMAQTPTFNWFSPLIVPNDKAQSTIQAVKTNRLGEVFTLASFGSKNEMPDAGTFVNLSFTGAPYITGTSYNSNFLLVKSDVSGNAKWAVYSDRGDISLSSCAFTPTSDGGAFVAIKVRHTNKNEPADNALIRLIDATGASQSISFSYLNSWVYQAILVKINGNGQITALNHIPVDYTPEPNASSTYSTATPDGFYFYDATTDDNGDIYLAGQVRKFMVFGNDTILPHNIGNWTGDSQSAVGNSFVVKLNDSGTYIDHLASTGSAVYDQIKKIDYDNGSLYITGLLKGDGSNTVSFGSKTITPSTLVSIFTGRVTTNLSVDYLQLLPGITVNGKNAIQLETLSLSKDKSSFFIGGGLMGGLAYTNQASVADLSAGGTMYNAFFVKCDAATGVCERGAIRSGKAISKVYGVLSSNDSIFAFGYDWTATNSYKIYLDSYDENFNQGVTYPLLGGGGSATAWGIAHVADTIIVATRAQKGQPISFLGSTQTYTVNNAYNWSGILSSFVLPERFTTHNGEPTDLQVVETNLKIYSTNGTVIIETDKMETINVYSASGMLVRQVRLIPGINNVYIHQGVYVIQKQKVVVL